MTTPTPDRLPSAEDFWRGRCLDCAHPDHEMTCHELVPNGDPSNGPAYCRCSSKIDLMEQEITRLRAALATEPGQLDAMTLAVAMNTAQIRPDEVVLGRDLRVPAHRILAALRRSRR